MKVENSIRLFALALNTDHYNLFMMHDDEISEALFENWAENVSLLEADMDALILGIKPKARTLCLSKAMCFFSALTNIIDVDNANNDYKSTSHYYSRFSIECITNAMRCCKISPMAWLNAFDMTFVSRPDPEEPVDPVDPPTPVLKNGIDYMQIEGDGVDYSQFIIS